MFDYYYDTYIMLFNIFYIFRVVGDLLLMEIWECLTQGYMRQRSVHYPGLAMRIASLPPIPSNVPQERCFELFNMSVDGKFPNTYYSPLWCSG